MIAAIDMVQSCVSMEGKFVVVDGTRKRMLNATYTDIAVKRQMRALVPNCGFRLKFTTAHR